MSETSIPESGTMEIADMYPDEMTVDVSPLPEPELGTGSTPDIWEEERKAQMDAFWDNIHAAEEEHRRREAAKETFNTAGDLFLAEDGDKEAEERLGKDRGMSAFLDPMVMQDKEYRDESIGEVVSQRLGTNPMFLYQSLKSSGLQGEEANDTWSRADYARAVTGMLRRETLGEKAKEEERKRYMQMIEDLPQTIQRVGRGEVSLDDVSPEEWTAMKQAGFSPATLWRVREVYGRWNPKTVGGKVGKFFKEIAAGGAEDYEAMAVTLRGDEVARRLFLNLVSQDGQQDERERRANPGKEMVKGAQERLTKSIVNAYTGIVREPMLWLREHLGQGSGGDKYWLSDEDKEWYAREITEENAMRADVEKAWEGGVAMAAEENPNIALDIERGVLGLADFALQFRNKKMMIGGIPALFNRNIREEAAGYRPHPVDEEEYNSKYAYIKQLLGKNGTEEEAKRLTDIWKVQTEGDSGKWESIVRGDMKGATEALVFLAGMGLIKKGMMMIPGLGSGVRRAAANWGSSYVGAFVQNTFNTGLAMGVVLPVGTAAAHYAVDSFLDPKMQKVSLGAEELQATLAAMRDGRYWLTNGAVALIGGAVSAPATMRYNRSMLAGAGVAKMLGVSEKQFYGEVAGKPGYTWRDKIFGLAGKNANEREGQDARKRAQEYIKTYGKVAEKWVRKEIAIEAALEELGVSFEKGKDGKVYMLTGGKVDKDGKFTPGQVRTEMTEDEADAYVVGVMGAKLNRMAAVMKNEAGKTRLLDAYKKYVKGEQDIVWLLNPERMEELVEKGKRASERLKQRMEEERGKEVKEGETKKEVDEREVGKEVHGDIDKDRSLNEVIREGESAAKRLEIARASGEDAEVTRANVTRYKNAAGKTIKRVLRIVNGASVREMSEELSEAVTQDFMEDNGVNDAQGYMMLRRFADFMRQSEDPDIKAAADAIDTLSKTHQEVAEKIMADGFDSQFMGGLSDAEVETVHQALTEGLSRMTELLMSGRGKRPDVEMPDWVDELMATRMTNELELQRELGMARAIEQAAKGGYLDETAQRLFGVGREAIENALRREAPPSKEELHRGINDYLRRQDELLARYGRSEDPILTDREYEEAKSLQEEEVKQRAAQQEAEDEEKKRALEEHIKEEKEAHPEKTEEEILKETAERENETKQARIEADPSAEADDAFEGGKCVRVEDPQNGNLLCKLGLVRLADLKILPQFKFGADKETGEVNPLTAPRFLPDADPIRVWRRKNGEMYIASGRHRAALARRTGVDKIMAFVYDEDDVHTEKWARRFDIELNIRDNQATVLECALFARGYFSEDGQPLSDEQVRVLGMDRKGSIGAIGLMIGREAGEDVMSAFRSGDISEQAAHAIVKFAPLSVPGNEKVQQAGLKELLELGTNHIDEARIAMTVERGKNMMRAEAVGATQTNLFGETEDSEAWTKFIKDYIKQKLDYQRAFVRFLSDIGTKKTSEAVRKRFESHLKSSDPQEIKKQLREERQILEMWRNPFEHPELRQEMTEAWNRKQGVTETSTTFSVVNRRLYDTVRGAFKQVEGEDGEKKWVSTVKSGTVFRVAPYPEVLNRIVPWTGRVIMRADVARKLLNKHGFTMHDVARLPQALWDPVAVFEEKAGSLIVITDVRTKNDRGEEKNALAVLSLRVDNEGAEITDVKSAYSADSKNKYKNLLEGKKLRYADKERTQDWAREEGSSIFQLLTTSLAEPGSGVMLKENMPDVNYNFADSAKKVGDRDVSTTFSVDDARKRGMMKEGVMRVGNAVVTEPGVTFSVEGAQHASPYLFREFDTKFMGSGEGNQAYGWGLYFSSNWGVNRAYWEQFSTEEPEIRLGDGSSIRGKDRYKKLADMFAEKAELNEEKRGFVEKNMERWVKRGNYAMEAWNVEAERLGKMTPGKLTAEERERWDYLSVEIAALDFLGDNGVKESEGRAVDYLVDLDVDEGELLPWYGKVGELIGRNKELEEGLLEIYRGMKYDWMAADEIEAAIERAMEGQKDLEGMYMYSWLVTQLGGQKEASEWLAAHGVKGIKYEDKPSRRREEKTYNYVVFDGKDVKIRAVNNRNEYSEYAPGDPNWERAEAVDFGTTYSVAGEKSEMWHANIERAFRDPRDGKMKYVIPLDGVRLKDSVTPGMMNVPVGGHKDVALRDLLEYEGLYEAYPELRDMRVRLYDDGGEGMRGLFRHRNGQAAYILLNVGKREGLSGEELRGKFLRTLLHEAQHAIQRYEGWGFGGVAARKDAIVRLLDTAIRQRIAVGMETEEGETAWQKANLDYLYDLKKKVEGMKESDAEWEKMAAEVVWNTSGEQESRWVQNGQEGELVPENAETITRAYAAADLGGITFEGLPNEVDRGLVPQGDFLVDRRVFQMKEAVARRMEALWRLLHKGEPGRAVEMAKEAGDIVREVERLLPPSYGFALEPYKIFFDSYAMLRGSGEADAAGSLVPMGDWAATMKESYEKVTESLMRGRLRRDLMPFYEGLTEGEKAFLAAAHEKWKEFEKVAREEEKENARRQQRKVDRQKILRETFQKMVEAYPDVDVKINKIQGKLRMDKLMAAFLKRVSMQLTAYRKDRVLGKIRSAIDALTPMPGKDGKPVKGRMKADDYKKLTDLVRLMEMTKGERDRFEQEHFVDDKGVAVWDDKPIDEKVAVTTYDNEGKEVTLEVTKGEFDTYACFDGMTAEQAERMAGALGEFIRTGRQAWDNAELAQRQKIGGWCRAAIDAYGETAGEKKARRQKEQRAMGALKKKFLAMTDAAMNDAQFFDAISSVPEMRGWTQDAVQRIANAHSYIEWQEKLRNEWLLEKAKEIFGTEDIGEITRLEDELRREEDTGIVLRQQAPNFEEQESGQLRKMFVNLLLRKTKTKNFNPNRMAAALKYLRESEAEIVPENVLREVEDKFGSLGDAAEYNGEPVEAWNALLTETERGRFEGMRERAKERAEKARAKWEEKRNVKAAEDLERGGTESTEIARRESEETLKLSRAQAAYRVLLCEQEDYEETLAQQGYTPEVVDRLREFAGEKMMAWAYALREKMGERTEEIANVYEKLYGMPFPKVENYFRAFFDVGYDVTQQAVLDDSGTGAAARGGSIKILRTRHHRVAPIDPTMSAFEAFQIGMKEQDVLLGYGELPRDLASILNYKQTIQYGEHQTRVAMQDVLENAYGSPVVVTMRGHVDNMVRLMREVGRFGVANMRLMQGLSRASAQGILNFRAGTLAKQFTAVFNAVSGAEDIEFFRDYMPSLMKVMMGLGRISPGELGKRPELAGRFKGWDTGAHGRSLFGATDARTAVGKTAIKAQRGMALMERLDVWCNQVSSAALYDAYYRRAQLANKELSREELDGMAMEQVRRALALKSQPLDWRQASFAATKPTFLTTAMFFLGGETFNTFGRAVSLAAKGEYKDAAALWLAQGAALQVMQAMFDFVTDDEEQRKRRTLGGYVFNVFAGPASGIPFLSTGLEKARNWAVRTDFGKRVKANSWLPHIQESSLLPTMDIEKVYRELKKAERTGDWESYALAVTDAMRETAILAAMATYNKTGSVALRVKAGALIVGAATNIADFLIRAERAQRQRWGWWGGKN